MLEERSLANAISRIRLVPVLRPDDMSMSYRYQELNLSPKN